MKVRGTNKGVSAPAQKVQRPQSLEDNVLTVEVRPLASVALTSTLPTTILITLHSTTSTFSLS